MVGEAHPGGGEGIDAVADLLDLAVDRGVVQKNGAYYAFGKDNIGHGREKTRAKLLEVYAYLSRTTISELVAVSTACEPESCESAAGRLADFLEQAPQP